MDKRPVSRPLGKYAVNPLVKLVAGYVPWWSRASWTTTQAAITSSSG